MSQYAIAASLVVFAVVAWDVSRRFFALQLRKLTESERLGLIEDHASRGRAELRQTIARVETDASTARIELRDYILANEKKTDKALVAIRRDVATLDENATELDGKMSRLVTQEAHKPRRMTIGGIKR